MKSVIAGLLLTVFCGACSMGAVDRRMTYWHDETGRDLPIGATHAQADEFFRARGTKLICCVSGPQSRKSYVVWERNVGRFLWMEYDVAVFVEFSEADRVQSIEVRHLGIGL